MQGWNKFLFAMLALASISWSGCKKETTYIYEVDDVRVRKDEGSKDVNKTMVEFISIAYADVMGSTINQTQLGQLSLLYLAFGDKRLIEDLLVKNMLNASTAQIPSDASMRADIDAFVEQTYLKLYNRLPNELEHFTLKKSIQDDSQLRPDMVYYSMMTADEYRFY